MGLVRFKKRVYFIYVFVNLFVCLHRYDSSRFNGVLRTRWRRKSVECFRSVKCTVCATRYAKRNFIHPPLGPQPDLVFERSLKAVWFTMYVNCPVLFCRILGPVIFRTRCRG